MDALRPRRWIRRRRRASLDEILRDLGSTALRFATLLGPLFAAVYLTAFVLTGQPSLLALTGFGLVAGLDSRRRLRRGDDNPALLMIIGGLSYAAAWPIVPPAVRSGLAAPVIAIAVLGALVLPAPTRRVVLTIFAAILAGQATWPLLGLSTARDALSQTLVTGGALFIALLTVGLARGAVEASERERREIFLGVPVGLFRLSRNGRITDVNPQLASMLGYRGDDLRGRLLVELFDQPAQVQELAVGLEASGSPQAYVQQVRRADGSHATLRGHIQEVRAPTGELLYYAGAVEDITEQIAAEARAHAEAERFQSVLDLAPIAIWEQDWSEVVARLDALRERGVSDLRDYLDTDMDEFFALAKSIRFTNVNPAALKIIGAETRQQAFASVITRDSPPEVIGSLIAQFEALWLGHDHVSVDFVGRRVDGEPIDITLIWGVGRSADGSIDPSRVIVVLADVTEARNAQRHLASLIESKDELVASVSHELRTPISSIMGMAYELHDRASDFSESERQELLSLIAEQSREVANIVEDLLVATRADIETLAIHHEAVAVVDEVRRIVAADKMDEKVTVSSESDVVAWADPLRLRQILRNLLSNARRYGGDTVNIIVRGDTDRVVVSVADDGPGVPPEEEEEIFLPYTRSRTDEAMPGSIGLGLPVSRRLARLMGGDLVYRFDGGSVFELSLPAAE